MNLRLVSFETAVLAKSKGFYGKIGFTRNNYDDYGRVYEGDDKDFNIPAPEQELLKMWLREKHNLHIEICVGDYVENENYYYNIFGKYKESTMIRCLLNSKTETIKTYELALESALQYGLSLIK